MDYGDTGGDWDYPMGKNQSKYTNPFEGRRLIPDDDSIEYEINPKDDNDVSEGNSNLLDELI